MINYETYEKIQYFRQNKLNKFQTANRLGISPHTVKSYWEITPQEFEERRKKIKQRKRRSKCEKFREEIIAMLKDFPEVSSAQIYDRLEEKYGAELEVKEGTLRNYIRRIRNEEGLERCRPKRDYQAVEELPPGYQAQADFGEITVRRQEDPDKRVKVYVFSIVLSYSRYKYSFWQDRPFNARDVVEAHLKAFEYFGGVPQTIVYDQDSRIVASENAGEVIFTETFQAFLNQMPFKPVICRKGDPESKGKIENVIGYHKNNFARGRLFRTIEIWNEENLSWLERRANGKPHQRIKETPAQRFSREKAFLQPAPKKINFIEPIVKHKLNKDNTLTFQSNRYDVPAGSYNECPEAGVQVRGERLLIFHGRTGELLAEHPLSKERGKLIRLNLGKKEISKSAREKCREAFEELGRTASAKVFIETVARRFPRYVKEQMNHIIRSCQVWANHPGLAEQAVALCLEREMISADNFKKALEFLGSGVRQESIPVRMNPNQLKRMEELMKAPAGKTERKAGFEENEPEREI